MQIQRLRNGVDRSSSPRLPWCPVVVGSCRLAGERRLLPDRFRATCTAMIRPVWLLSMDTDQFCAPPLTTGALKAFFLAHGGRGRTPTSSSCTSPIATRSTSGARRRGRARSGRAPRRRSPPASRRCSGLSCYTWNVAEFLEIVRQAKREVPGLLVVAGGPHVQRAEDFLYDDGIDVIVLGEGEETFTQLLDCTSRDAWESVPGLAFLAADRSLRQTPARGRSDRARPLSLGARRRRVARHARRAALQAGRLRDQPRLPLPLLLLRVGNRRDRHQDVPVLARPHPPRPGTPGRRRRRRISGSATRTSARCARTCEKAEIIVDLQEAHRPPEHLRDVVVEEPQPARPGHRPPAAPPRPALALPPGPADADAARARALAPHQHARQRLRADRQGRWPPRACRSRPS